VRVVSKRAYNGKLYGKKVHVTTILDKFSFEAVRISEEDDRRHHRDDKADETIFADLREKDLETVLPSSKDFATKPVIVLRGSHKGESGKIIDMDKRRDKVTI